MRLTVEIVPFYPVIGVGELLFGNGSRGYLTAEMLSSMDREASPASTNFNQVVIGSKTQFFADGV